MIVSVLTPGASLLPWSTTIPGALLINWLPGQEMGNGFADVVFGTVNPSARLSVTFPNIDNEMQFTESQYPGVNFPPEASYTEGLFVGYRWYDGHVDTTSSDSTSDSNELVATKPNYPFGYGLSYTQFEYSNMQVTYIADITSDISTSTSSSNTPNTPTSSVTDTLVSVSIDVSNIGQYAGDEIIQLYLQYPTSAQEPLHQLRGFQKKYFKNFQNHQNNKNIDFDITDTTETIEFNLTRRDMSIWDIELHNWVLVSTLTDPYIIHIGSSSRNIYKNTTINF